MVKKPPGCYRACGRSARTWVSYTNFSDVVMFWSRGSHKRVLYLDIQEHGRWEFGGFNPGTFFFFSSRLCQRKSQLRRFNREVIVVRTFERKTLVPEWVWGPTRWSTRVSSKVNLHHAFDFRALCGANLVTLRSRYHPNETLVLHRVVGFGAICGNFWPRFDLKFWSFRVFICTRSIRLNPFTAFTIVWKSQKLQNFNSNRGQHLPQSL